MRRYWFRFNVTMDDAPPLGVLLGCGVTARDRSDAEALIRARVFRAEPVPPLAQLIEDVEVSALDQRHVVPNMGDPTKRGVWYPLGYD